MKTLSKVSIILCLILFTNLKLFSTPPIFDTLGVERLTNSIYYVVEGNAFQFTVTAHDPDGDILTYWAEDVPNNWANFDSVNNIFSGIAPYWSNVDSIREKQPGKFDVKFYVTDGTYTVEKVVTIMILDSLWDLNATIEDLVLTRPIDSGGDIGTPVSFNVLSDSLIWTNYAGGKNIRKITIHYESQVVSFDTIGWDCDAIVFLPENCPDTLEFGALVEGGYSGNFGEEILSLKTCALFDIPVMIFDRDWQSGEGGDLYDECIKKAVSERDPHYLFLTYSTAHYLRSGDALISVIDSLTNSFVDYNTFKYAFTGHSKFGHTCVMTALAKPDKVIGFMSSGAMDIDDNGSRLLTLYQGAQSSNPGTSVPYIGVMTTYFQESLKINQTTNQNQSAFFIMGTDDTKNVETKYMPKYASFLLKNQLSLENNRICMVPNTPHTTQTSFHSIFWETLLGKLTFNNTVTRVDSVWYNKVSNNLDIEAYISGNNITEVNVWATNEPDTNNSNWLNYTSFSMNYVSGRYVVSISSPVTSFYIEVINDAGGINSITTSEIFAVNKNYKYLHIAPTDVTNLQTTIIQDTIKITWNNPLSSDFVNTMITYSTNNYPQTPIQGTLIYDGNGEQYNHVISDTSQTYYYTIFCYDSLGNYSTGINFNSMGQVSIKEVETNNNLNFVIYPNPASQTVNISNIAGYNITITDVSGKTVFSQLNCTENKLNVDVSNFNKGLYIVKVNDNKNIITKKLIVY